MIVNALKKGANVVSRCIYHRNAVLNRRCSYYPINDDLFGFSEDEKQVGLVNQLITELSKVSLKLCGGNSGH